MQTFGLASRVTLGFYRKASCRHYPLVDGQVGVTLEMTPGERLGPYEIVSALGAGGMGAVFVARDQRLERLVALKVLPTTADEDGRRRFLTEARAAAALCHPNVATIYDVGEIGPTSFIAMELVAGCTLAEKINAKPIVLEEIGAIGIAIADALQAAHDKAIVHRDIKPGNVMITGSGQVKVLDFGLAKVVTATFADARGGPVTQPGMVMGTVPYMSPEQLLGDAVDHRSDVFSLGIVLYQMATGRLPFGDTTELRTVASIRNAQPESSGADAARELERIICKCVERRPDRRYQSAREIAIDLEALLRAMRSELQSPRAVGRGNLPVQLTSFVGREQELRELPSLVAASRLLSLVGAGGAGKTRLALRLAADLERGFPDGVWYVDLAPLSDASLVAQTIATAVGIREGQNRSVRDALLEGLRQRQLLIVLDNCEHLIDVCAEIAAAVLQSAPAIHIVATSREPLGVAGENVWRVRSLGAPDTSLALSVETLAAFDATRLFMSRAEAVDPSFRATAANASTIARICERLDGIPLAIELAAARVAVLSVEQIETRLRDRFRLLTGGTRTAVARQRTLEATVDWSYQLLSELERRLFARLSVFPSTWTLEVAEQVCSGDDIAASDVLDLLSGLVSRSLVAVEGESGSKRRYRFLETMRQYARDRLFSTDEVERLRQRHFEFFFNDFRGALSGSRGWGELACLQRIGVEQDNLRAALEFGLEDPASKAQGLELAGALFWYWTKRGQFAEGRRWLERALANPTPAQPSARARARALLGLTQMHYFQSRFAEAAACATEALPLAESCQDTWAISIALFMGGLCAFEQGDLEGAADLSSRSRLAADVCGDPLEHGGPLLTLGSVALARGDPETAQRLFDKSIEVCRRGGEKWGLGILLAYAAALRVSRGELDQARRQAVEGLSLCQELQDPRGMAWALEVLASLLVEAGQAEDAARLCGASDVLQEMVGARLPPIIEGVRKRYLERMGASFDSTSVSRARDEGRGLSSSQAIELVNRAHAAVR